MNFNWLSAWLKAHLAGIGAALSVLIADLNTEHHITMTDWYWIVGAALGVGAVVAVAPNTTKQAVAPAVVVPPKAVAPAKKATAARAPRTRRPSA